MVKTWCDRTTKNQFKRLVLSPGQTIATFQQNISKHCWALCCAHLATLLRTVARSCDMLGVLLAQIFKFSIPNMSKDVATGWPNARNMLRYVVLKCCDHLAGAFKCWANSVGICCVDMLRSFGRGFTFWKVLVSKCRFLFYSRFKRLRLNRTACQRLNV